MAYGRIVETLTQIYPLFSELQNVTTKHVKEIYVDAILGNPDAKNLLCFALNPMLTTHLGESLRQIDVSQLDCEPYPLPDVALDAVMDVLRSKNGDSTVKKLVLLIKEEIPSEDIQKFWMDFVTQQLTVGVTAASVNRIAGKEIIPVFNVMLAEKFFSYPGVVQNKRFYITEKLDGCRAFVTVVLDKDGANPTVNIYSRTGKPYEGLVDVERELVSVAVAEKQSLYLDGELIVTDRETMPSKEAFKKTSQILRTDGEKHGITFNVFDFISKDEWEKKKGVRPYWARREWLDDLKFFSDTVKIVPVLYSGTDTEMIYRIHDEEKARNHEGIMINIADARYEFKRTKSLLKVKTMNDMDLTVIGANRGIGRFKDTLGSLIVEFDGTEVSVGSGFSVAERDEIWSNVNQYIGRIATVQYFEITEDDKGNRSLRFPVFKAWRNDIDTPKE